jgi:DnaK suppressor protein
MLAQVRQDMDDVESALARLEDGSYGHCEACGAAFSAEQLEAQPAVRRCPACL